MSVSMFLVGYAFILFQEEYSEIKRIDSGVTLAPVAQPQVDPVNILVVGVDNAQGVEEGDSILTGRNTTSMLTDSILIIRLDPQEEKVRVLSLPRDLWVELGDTGRKEKINAAVTFGGPDLLIQTIQKQLNISINHYVQVNFQAFRNVVDAIGGIPLEFEAPTKDPTTGLIVEQPGCTMLNGAQSLAFVRSRSYEELQNGQWITDPTGDLGRVQRQQIFITAAIKKALLSTGRNPSEAQNLFNSIKTEIVLDNEISTQTILNWGSKLQGFSVASLETFTLPTTPGNEGSAWVLYLETEDAKPALSHFRPGSPVPLPPPDPTAPPPPPFLAPQTSEKATC